MRRKYGRLRKKENLIVFPGTFERLVEKGTVFVENGEFEDAVEAFDQAIVYEPHNPEFLVPYAIALYEVKNFAKAKEIATQLLHSGTSEYIEAMELYLTISIQLQEYEEVEITIDALISEGIIPSDRLKKFNYLRDLNNRLAKRYGEDLPTLVDTSFTMEAFNEMDSIMQQHALASLEGTDLQIVLPLLLEIVKRSDLSPLVITFGLTLLHQIGFSEEVTVQKFGSELTIIPADMALPGQDEVTNNVIAAIERMLSKDPSRLELAIGTVEKFAITAFPFGWGDYEVDEIATAYVQYIDSLFSGTHYPETPLDQFIKQIDTETELELE
ncbi:tetratricopeptide repeat protein [Sporosarcina sp. CAU 1771]